MRRNTRDSMAIGTDQRNLAAGNGRIETPPPIFAAIQERCGQFYWDLAADADNALVPRWFGPGSAYAEDCLTANWLGHIGGRPAFGNPPYGAFVRKYLAWALNQAMGGQPSVHLLPLRATKAFHKYVIGWATHVLVCDRRITFWDGGKPKLTLMKDGSLEATPALFDSMIVVYDRVGLSGCDTKIETFKVPEHVRGFQ